MESGCTENWHKFDKWDKGWPIGERKVLPGELLTIANIWEVWQQNYSKCDKYQQKCDKCVIVGKCDRNMIFDQMKIIWSERRCPGLEWEMHQCHLLVSDQIWDLSKLAKSLQNLLIISELSFHQIYGYNSTINSTKFHYKSTLSIVTVFQLATLSSTPFSENGVNNTHYHLLVVAACLMLINLTHSRKFSQSFKRAVHTFKTFDQYSNILELHCNKMWKLVNYL